MLGWWSETLSWEQNFFSILNRDKGSSDGKESACNVGVQFSSVTQLCPTLRPHELQHTRTPCTSPIPGVYPNSCPLSRWCHPTISSSVIPFSCPQSFPASGSFQTRSYFSTEKHIWVPTVLGSSSFSVLYFCLFILIMGFLRQGYWSGLPFPSPVDHVLSDLSTMTHPSWVAPHSMA